MNERIKELAVAAAPANSSIPHSEWNIPKEFIEKFAELIVAECVNAVMDGTKEGDHYAQRIENHFDNGDGGILHFGVER